MSQPPSQSTCNYALQYSSGIVPQFYPAQPCQQQQFLSYQQQHQQQQEYLAADRPSVGVISVGNGVTTNSRDVATTTTKSNKGGANNKPRSANKFVMGVQNGTSRIEPTFMFAGFYPSMSGFSSSPHHPPFQYQTHHYHQYPIMHVPPSHSSLPPYWVNGESSQNTAHIITDSGEVASSQYHQTLTIEEIPKTSPINKKRKEHPSQDTPKKEPPEDSVIQSLFTSIEEFDRGDVMDILSVSLRGTESPTIGGGSTLDTTLTTTDRSSVDTVSHNGDVELSEEGPSCSPLRNPKETSPHKKTKTNHPTPHIPFEDLMKFYKYRDGLYFTTSGEAIPPLFKSEAEVNFIGWFMSEECISNVIPTSCLVSNTETDLEKEFIKSTRKYHNLRRCRLMAEIKRLAEKKCSEESCPCKTIRVPLSVIVDSLCSEYNKTHSLFSCLKPSVTDTLRLPSIVRGKVTRDNSPLLDEFDIFGGAVECIATDLSYKESADFIRWYLNRIFDSSDLLSTKPHKVMALYDFTDIFHYERVSARITEMVYTHHKGVITSGRQSVDKTTESHLYRHAKFKHDKELIKFENKKK